MAYVVEEKHVKFIAYKLKREAATWWDQLQIIRRRQDKPPVMIWRHMKQLLRGRFLSLNCQQILYNQFEHCKQGIRTVAAAYTEEFYRLSSRRDLSITEEQQAAKYINSLKYPIRERVIRHDAFSVDEAHNKAMKIERLQKRVSSFKSVTEKHPAVQELSRVPHRAIDLQPIR